MNTLCGRPLTFGDQEQIEMVKCFERQARQKEASKNCKDCNGHGHTLSNCDECNGTGEIEIDCKSCKINPIA